MDIKKEINRLADDLFKEYKKQLDFLPFIVG